MEKRTGYKMGEDELTLLGKEVKVGDIAPSFRLVSKDMEPVTLESLGKKVKIITAVPSLDTPVCQMETTRFNQEADKLGDGLAVLTVSMDLPFAQQRFCSAEGVKNLTVASDYVDHSFGEAYGCLIEGLTLLNRSVFVLDADNKVTYVEYLEQNTNEPDYDKALAAAKALL